MYRHIHAQHYNSSIISIITTGPSSIISVITTDGWTIYSTTCIYKERNYIVLFHGLYVVPGA